MPPSIHILLIDDHVLIRSGLRMLLAGAMPGAVVREAGSVMEAVQHVTPPQVAPDIVLLDLELPGLSGLEGLAVLRAKWPRAPVLVVSSHTEPDVVRNALARGAAGYVSKAEPAVNIIAAITRALRGESAADISAAPMADAGLTPRQCEVLALLCEGLPNKLIGRRLNLSENTVRGHVQAILAMLQVSSRKEAAFAARQRGLVR